MTQTLPNMVSGQSERRGEGREEEGCGESEHTAVLSNIFIKLCVT